MNKYFTSVESKKVMLFAFNPLVLAKTISDKRLSIYTGKSAYQAFANTCDAGYILDGWSDRQEFKDSKQALTK